MNCKGNFRAVRVNLKSVVLNYWDESAKETKRAVKPRASRLEPKLHHLAYFTIFLVILPNHTPQILCNQMIYLLTRTYFCKSCTKTYNF